MRVADEILRLIRWRSSQPGLRIFPTAIDLDLVLGWYSVPDDLRILLRKAYSVR